ncbi:MAG: cache domain-containing protein [Pseudomonadota bacterium]
MGQRNPLDLDYYEKKSTLITLGRIIVPLGITVILFALIVFLLFVPSMKKYMIDQKKELIRELSDSHCSMTCSLLSEYSRRVTTGELTLEDAKTRAAKRIRNLRYGPDGEDYFWIIDIQAKMIMHPYMSDLEGRDLSDFEGPDGKRIFVEFVSTAKQKGSGYVDYLWQNSDNLTDKTSKISYIKLFEPWQWIVGASVHVDDIHSKIKLITRQLIELSAGILVIALILTVYATWQVMKIEKQRSEVAKAHHLDMLRLKKLRELNQMAEASLEDLMQFSLEEAIQLTRSSAGYLVLLNDDETEVTLHVWSRSVLAESSIPRNRTVPSGTNRMTELWETVVDQRKAIIVNEFDKMESCRNTDLPEGHIRIMRHLTIPVFDGDRIVAVAGMANKKDAYDNSDIWQLNLLMDGMWKIIHRKRSEIALRESETRYRLLTENVTDNIWTLQLSDMSLLYISPSIENILGYTCEQMHTLGLKEYLTEESLKKLSTIITEELDRENQPGVDPKRSFVTQLEQVRKNGSSIWTEITACFLRDEAGIPNRILGVTRDITRRRHMEQQLHHSQKMEAIGTLAGGIAHDFNNILSSILGFTQLAKMSCPEGSELNEKLNKIFTAGIRARDLIRHIMVFSRKQDVKREAMSIVPIIKECLNFIRASIPKNIDIIHDLDEADCTVMADASQIQQILMNLCSNAAHSMKGKSGLIEVRLKPVQIESLENFQVKGLEQGMYLKLMIADSGCGIPEEILQRIFEPFFTTKELGEGTGMGLSIVHGIVTSMRGAISVYSEAGKGSVFQILLPVYGGKAREITGSSFLANGGTGRILLVDDEEDIVISTQQILMTMGYTVVGVGSSQEALEIFKKKPDGFDLVLTDLAMPKMTGVELSQELLKIREDIPIVLCTGFSEGVTSTMSKRMGIFTIIMKPVIAGELREVIKSALNGTRK